MRARSCKVRYAMINVIFLISIMMFCFVLFVEFKHSGNLYPTSIAAIKNASLPNIKNVLEEEPIFDDAKEVTAVKNSASNAPVRNAVVHVGPHKTGSTTIQHMAHEANEILRGENYDIIMAPFASCFIASDNQCTDDELLEYSSMCENGRNLFISAENLDNPDVDFIALKKFLRHWDNVTIVIYYRRFFDWLQSFHHEVLKKKIRAGRYYKTIVYQLTRTKWRNMKQKSHTNAVVERFKEHFDNVVIKNFHDKESDIYESLFCDDIPNADKTCQKVREMDPLVKNSSSGVPYEVITFYALKARLIKGEHSDLATAIQEAHIRIRDGNLDDFIFNCPSESVLNAVLDDSLMMEEELFPEFFTTPSGEKALRNDFEKLSKSKLCEIDKTTIDRPVWKGIFEELIQKE